MHRLNTHLPGSHPTALLMAICLIVNLDLTAQSLEGLWLVEEVKVEDQILTPRDRWFKFDTEGNYTSGNGWLQHSSGAYVYNASDSSFLPQEDYSLKDPFGAFKLWFEKDGMIWQRYESDMLVTVKLKRSAVLPRSLADQMKGRWQLDSVKPQNEAVIEYLDTNNAEILFLRWDREYRTSNAGNNLDRGYWHLHGHRPELTLISRSAEQTFITYTVSQEGESLILKKENDEDGETTRYYHRVHEPDSR